MKNKYILSIILISAIAAGTIGFYGLKHNSPKATEPIELHNTTAAPTLPEVSPEEKVSDKQNNKKIDTSVQQQAAKTPKATEQDFENAAIMYKDGIISQEEYDKKVNNLTKTISTD